MNETGSVWSTWPQEGVWPPSFEGLEDCPVGKGMSAWGAVVPDDLRGPLQPPPFLGPAQHGLAGPDLSFLLVLLSWSSSRPGGSLTPRLSQIGLRQLPVAHI